jgi:hypothetical protein
MKNSNSTIHSIQNSVVIQMPDDLHTKLLIALLAAIFGGIIGGLVNFVLLPRYKRCSLTKGIEVYQIEPQGNVIRFRVYNRGYWTIAQAVIYITLDSKNDDVVSPPNNHDAFIKPGDNIPLEGDQLCWSVRWPKVNPMKVDIYAKERQPFSLCDVVDDKIMIPSEEGWDMQKAGPRRARIFLRRKKYCGAIKIVTADTDARFFHITIKPDNNSASVEITPVCKSRCKFRV